MCDFDLNLDDSDDTALIHHDDETKVCVPSHDELASVGFNEDAIQEILEGDPAKAQELYDVMCRTDTMIDNTEKLIADNEVFLHGHHYEGDIIDSHKELDEKKMGSCDCRSECRYNTGKTYEYADYGYSD